MRRLPRFYSDLTRPYVPGLVVHEVLRRITNASLLTAPITALRDRLTQLAQYR